MNRKNLVRMLLLVFTALCLLLATPRLHSAAGPDKAENDVSRSELAVRAILPIVVSSRLPGEAMPVSDTDYFSSSDRTLGSILPVVTESGFISLSVDGVGTASTTGVIQVEKPAGATVRSAYMAAASRGFSGRRIGDGQITIAGNSVVWDIVTPNSISSYNHWADVTAVVKPLVDAAPAGRVNLDIRELIDPLIDGELLAVIFDDPNQPTKNTVVLLFGAQEVGGDTFKIALAEPIDTANPDLTLDMSLGISFSFQGTGQFTLVDVNGTRLTTSAGGQDDGIAANGALFTVGGLDDDNGNPPPSAIPSNNPRIDDELYSLVPFVGDGDTSITIFTRNPSRDDNILFSSLFLTGEAIVGEGILLSPDGVTNPVGDNHTVTARIQDDDGNPVAGRQITFNVVAGPNTGLTGTGNTDASGESTFTYTSALGGTDVIDASFVDSRGITQTSNQVTKTWEIVNQPPTIAADGDLVAVDEGQTATNTGTFDDPDGDPLALTPSIGSITNNSDGTWSWSFATTDGPAESQTVTITADDGNGGTVGTTFTLTVNNLAPTVATPAVPTDPVSLDDQPLNVTATFGDPAGTADEPYTCTVDYGDGSGQQSGAISGATCTGPDHAYAGAGTYLVTVAVTDKDGGTGQATANTYIVVYDPHGGFITAGGWIWSEAGDCHLNPGCAAAASKATFGLVSKYKKDAERPMGNTEFQFHAGDLNFHANSYDWLVVAGARAQYQGEGTIDGLGTYKFRLTIYDAAVDDADPFETDRFRMRIWIEDEAAGAETVVYDSGSGADLDDGGDSGTDLLESGSITIHSRP